MALIKCPECGKEVSDKASCCVHCGCPINKDDSIPATSSIKSEGFYYLSRQDNTVSLECKQCHRKWNYRRGSFSNIIGENCVITASALKCPNCSNVVSAGTRIESKVSYNSCDESSHTEEDVVKTTPQDKAPQKRIGCGTQLLIFIVLLVLVGMLFGENPYESTGRSAFEKFGKGEFSSMTQAERSYMDDFFKWQHEQQTK